MGARFTSAWSRLGITVTAAAIGVLVGTQIAGAHVTVVPNQSPAGAYELYSVRVPTEKAIPTVKVRLDFPAGVDVSRFAPAPGWTRAVDKDATGRIVAVTWSGGSIASDEIGLFAFQGRNGTGGALSFKATQTYSDGSVVEWANAPTEPNPAPVVTLTKPAMSAADLSDATAVGQVVAAITYLDAVGFHGIDTAIAGGEIPSGTLGKVQNALAVTTAVRWPSALHDDSAALVDHLRDLVKDLGEGKASVAADPAKAVHDAEHSLSRKAWAWLRDMGGDDHGSDAHAH